MLATSRMKWPGAVLIVPLALLLASGLARAQSFGAPLVQCTSVTKPAALTDCAAVNDPLKRGVATINDMGDATVAIAGAATNTTYAVSFVSGDGIQSAALGNLTTNNKGDGAFRHDVFFKFGAVGAGNVVLSSGGFEEFVTGISISSNGLESAADFQPALVRCADVAVPGALSSCGNDPLTSGRADVENDDGALSIYVNGARLNSSYSAILRAPDGTTTALGTVGPTDNHGNATLIVPAEFRREHIWLRLYRAAEQQRRSVRVRVQGESEVRAPGGFGLEPGSMRRRDRSGRAGVRKRPAR